MTKYIISKKSRLDIAKWLLLMGKLALMNLQVDYKKMGDETEDKMVESLSMLQTMISREIGISPEETSEALKNLDVSFNNDSMEYFKGKPN